VRTVRPHRQRFGFAVSCPLPSPIKSISPHLITTIEQKPGYGLAPWRLFERLQIGGSIGTEQDGLYPISGDGIEDLIPQSTLGNPSTRIGVDIAHSKFASSVSQPINVEDGEVRIRTEKSGCRSALTRARRSDDYEEIALHAHRQLAPS